MSTTYNNCKKIISFGKYDKEDMLDRLDTFLLVNRISKDEYKELVHMIELEIIAEPEAEPELEPEEPEEPEPEQPEQPEQPEEI